MVSKNLIDKYKLDEEEIELLKEEEKEITEKENEQFFEKAVKNLNKKTKSISLRINNETLNNIKLRAEKDGLNYQTIINLLIFKYANGELNLKIE